MNIHTHLKKLKTAQSPLSITDNNNAANKFELLVRSGSLYFLIKFVKLFIQLICLYLTLILADAATTSVTVEGQNYTVTYETTSYNEAQFQSTLWWGSSSTAKSFANATSVNSVVYAHEIDSSLGFPLLKGRRSNGSGGYSTSLLPPGAPTNYAVSAVAVPAPLPIIGILPVVGFLKRMRKRQHS